MTNGEFSDSLTVMLNSYATAAQFGEEASKREIVLDEYEKSVLLTQAQDIIVKSYFDGRLNSQGQGFDDSTRRQVDFSSLIKVAELEPVNNSGIISLWDGNSNDGAIRVTNKLSSNLRFILNGIDRQGLYSINPNASIQYGIYAEYNTTVDINTLTVYMVANIDSTYDYTVSQVIRNINDYSVNGTTIRNLVDLVIEEDKSDVFAAHDWDHGAELYGDVSLVAGSFIPFDTERGLLYNMPEPSDGRASTDVLFILNERLITTDTISGKKKTYVVVPISYKEYDREMSKPYAQPLKKQAWRLFQNTSTGFDVNTELIPRFNISNTGLEFKYLIRYVRRPRPIVLEDMPDGLEIDGVSTYSECELNPILHMDILNKAVEIAVATRGGRAAKSEATV